MPLASRKQPGTPAFKRLFAAAAAAACLSAVSAQASFNATVHGVGADYFSEDLHSFVCQVVPEDGTQPFYTGCSRDQAHDLGGEPVTLELRDNTQAADLNLAAQEHALGIVRPATQISKATGGRRRARRLVTDGPRSILMMIINYADVQVDYIDEAGARRMIHNPDGQDVNGLYRSSSYNRLSFPNELVTVITITSPVRIRDQSPTECLYVEWSEATDELIAAQHPNVNLDQFMHKVYLLPRDVPACTWSGVAFVDTCNSLQNNGRNGRHCKAWVRDPSPTILAHELGHNLGTIHASDDWDDDGVQYREYGDLGCVMGMAGWATMNAPHRELLGYLGDGNGVETHDTHCAADSPAVLTLTISRLDLAPGRNNPHPTMIRVPRYPAKDYLLSFKAPSDWDGTSVNDIYRNRLQIHTHDGSRINTLIVRTLFLSESFTGETWRDGSMVPVPLTITVTAVNSNDITFTIDTGCGTNRPTQFGETRAPTAAPTGPQMLQGDITCGQIVTGDTARPGTSLVGNAAADHIWHFTLAEETEVTFDGCASSFDTWIRVFDRDLTTELAEVDDSADHCATLSRSHLTTTLGPGDYSVIMEGYGHHTGRYIMEMSMPMGCPETNRPTASPSATVPTFPPVGGPGCADNHQYCHVWARQGHCSGDHSNYMTVECPASCFRCSGQQYGTPPVNPDMPEEDDSPTHPPPTSPPTNPPTSPPTQAQCHVAECGKDGGCGSGFESSCDIHSAQHEVRCCSSSEKQGWRTWVRNGVTECTNVWGASQDSAQQFECSFDKTFHEAEAICASVGARLCTVTELRNDCTRGTGCGHDRAVVWSSDTAPGVAFAADLGNRNQLAYTSTEEPTTNSTREQEQSFNSLSATTSNDDSSNDGILMAAIFGTLAVVAVLAAILYVRQQGQKSKQLDHDDYGPPRAASRRISLRRNADVEDPADFPPLTLEMPSYPDEDVDAPSRETSSYDTQPIPLRKLSLVTAEDSFALASTGRSVRREDIKTIYIDGLDDLKIVGATSHRRDIVKTVYDSAFLVTGQETQDDASSENDPVGNELFERIASRSRASMVVENTDGRNRSDSYSLSIRPPSPPSFPAETPTAEAPTESPVVVQGGSRLVPPPYQPPPV